MRRRWLTALVVPLFTIALGCALGPKPPPAPPTPVYASWEVDTLAELDQLMNVKACEGWRLHTTFPRAEKLVVIIVRDGPAPPPRAECRGG